MQSTSHSQRPHIEAAICPCAPNFWRYQINGSSPLFSVCRKILLERGPNETENPPGKQSTKIHSLSRKLVELGINIYLPSKSISSFSYNVFLFGCFGVGFFFFLRLPFEAEGNGGETGLYFVIHTPLSLQASTASCIGSISICLAERHSLPFQAPSQDL